LIGLALQAALLGHGGFTTIGINACVLTVPALLAGWLFAIVYRSSSPGKPGAMWVVGWILGMVSVLATLVLQAAVLLWGGTEDWHQIVWLVFYAHLPIVVLEGVVLGFTVSFLARVKPEMLGPIAPGLPGGNGPPALLLAVLTILFAAGSARAHRLDAAYTVLPDRQVQIESWFDLGGVPKGAKVQVFRPGSRLLAEGQLDESGCFLFPYNDAEPLEVIVSAGAGHRKAFVIPREALEPSADTHQTNEPSSAHSPRLAGGEPSRTMVPEEAWRERFKDALLGVSFLLALGAFILSWCNGRKLNPKKGE
jgi:hypothetical protein